MRLKDLKQFDRPLVGLLVLAATMTLKIDPAEAHSAKAIQPARAEPHDPWVSQTVLERLRCPRLNAYNYFLMRGSHDPADRDLGDLEYGLQNGRTNCVDATAGQTFILQESIETMKQSNNP